MSVVPEKSGWFSKSTKFTIVTPESSVDLSLKKGDRDTLILKIQKVINDKEWEKPLPSFMTTNKKKAEFSSNTAGIAGLIQKQQDKMADIDTTMKEAFSDLKALMNKAKEMVQLAELLQVNHSSSEDNEVRDLMLDIGLVASPVNKQMTGNLFHTELARQLADFLTPYLAKKNNEIITLTDAYCLYNRARGTDLISPNDLYEATLLFEKLNLPLELRKFETGVLAIQSKSYRDENMLNRIREECVDKFPMTIVEFAKYIKIPVQLASYFLLKAENEGMLCRDDSYEGLIFYPNSYFACA
eukprot:TRINITY_DN3829_c0_g1_i3.p1 TRINITY_DN3829_c0_g1~~TRINITY_DN3829_c0_g1_i3.p1  ORF type:complete len:299 (-),score=63.04 TRINITY_DN3829_c0_g1_i3:134-1030(-)